MSSTHCDNSDLQTKPVPRQAKTSELWNRFLEALLDLGQRKSDDQTDIGKAVGVGQTMISSYKTGPKLPSMKHARNLASYAQMCVEFLLTGQGPQRPWGNVDDEFKRLIQYWEALDDSHRVKLIEHAQLLFTNQGHRRKARHVPSPESSSRPQKKTPH